METHYGLGIHAFGSPVDRGKVSWEWIFGSLALLSREGNSQTGDRMFALDIFVSLHINVWMYLSDTSRPPPTTRNNRSTVDDECWVVGGVPVSYLWKFSHHLTYLSTVRNWYKSLFFWSYKSISLSIFSSNYLLFHSYLLIIRLLICCIIVWCLFFLYGLGSYYIIISGKIAWGWHL